jgi:hypothetical protein
LRTRIQMELAAASEAAGDHDGARVHARAAVDLAEGQGDESMLAEGLALVAFYDFVSGKGTQRSVMNRAVGLEGWEGTSGPPEPDLPRGLRVAVDGRPRRGEIDVDGHREALPGRRR